MTISDDLKFEFDVQGYLHLRGALPSAEVAEYLRWSDEAQQTDIKILNQNAPEDMKHQLNRPVSRIIDADLRFARFLDHPVVKPFLIEFLGEDYRHIDNDLYYTHPNYEGGHWHRGVSAHPTGHVIDGKFICPMVKAFYCLTDVGPGEGEFVVIPGSQHTQFKIDQKRLDLPGMHIFDNVTAGDIIIFNEALIHNGRPNRSQKTRKTIIVNFGRREAAVWNGYQPRPETLAAVTPAQRQILTNVRVGWKEPDLPRLVEVN